MTRKLPWDDITCALRLGGPNSKHLCLEALTPVSTQFSDPKVQPLPELEYPPPKMLWQPNPRTEALSFLTPQELNLWCQQPATVSGAHS